MPSACRLGLMTDGACDAVGGRDIGVMRSIERQAGEDCGVVAGSFVDEVLQGHVASGALVLNGDAADAWSSASRRTLACQ